MANNKVVFGNTTVMDITDTTAEESDVAEGKVFYKANGTRSVGTMSAGAYSFVGMVVSGTNLTTEASVQAIYGSSTSWTLISSVMLSSEHVFGNGYVLGVTRGGDTRYGIRGRGDVAYTGLYGDAVGSASSGSVSTTAGHGVVSKAQAGANPEYSGLVADTITVYSWERTA